MNPRRITTFASVTTLLALACAPAEPGTHVTGVGVPGWGDQDEDEAEGGDTTGDASEDEDEGGDDSPDETTGEEPAGDEETGEPAPVCEPPVLDARRALIETDEAVLADWTLAEVLGAIASNAGLTPDAIGTHNQLFDTFRLSFNGLFAGPHCDDEQPGFFEGGGLEGFGALNGFPMMCPRSEGTFATFSEALDGWFATAVVNRVDLAAADGSHCGEQRIVFANPNMVGRAFIIFEAQIPNPAPGCGVSACAPLAEAWAQLDEIDDPSERSARLRAAFLDGDATLTAAGFGPFMSADNLTFGTGQVRTNNFVVGPWTLREHKLVAQQVDGQQVVRAQPVPVAASAHDALWNDTNPTLVGDDCRNAFIDALPGLMVDDVATMGWSIPPECFDSESAEGRSSYDEHMQAGSGAFANAINAEIQALSPGSALTAVDIARRAEFAGSCMGCHEHANNIDLGNGIKAPPSLGFVHVDEQHTEPCGGGQCFKISPALTDHLLPHRMEVLTQLLMDSCENGCEMQAPVPQPGHALAAPGTSIEQLRAIDRSARSGGLTLGGQPVGTH